MRNFKEGEKLTAKGKEYSFIKASAKNKGRTHVWVFDLETKKQTQIMVSDITVKNQNPRYTVFFNHHGDLENYLYILFISSMASMFTGTSSLCSSLRVIRDHDAFTSFIKSNAHLWNPSKMATVDGRV